MDGYRMRGTYKKNLGGSVLDELMGTAPTIPSPSNYEVKDLELTKNQISLIENISDIIEKNNLETNIPISFEIIKKSLKKRKILDFSIIKDGEEFEISVSCPYDLKKVQETLLKINKSISISKEIDIRTNVATGSPVVYLVKKITNSDNELVKNIKIKLFDFISLVNLLESLTYRSDESLEKKQENLYNYIDSLEKEKMINLKPVKEVLDYLKVNKPNIWQLTFKNKNKDSYFKEVRDLINKKLSLISKEEVYNLYVK